MLKWSSRLPSRQASMRGTSQCISTISTFILDLTPHQESADAIDQIIRSRMQLIKLVGLTRYLALYLCPESES